MGERFTRRPPRRRTVLAPERHPRSGRYAASIGHADKEVASGDGRPIARIVAAALAAAAVLALVVVLLTRGGHDGRSAAGSTSTSTTAPDPTTSASAAVLAPSTVAPTTPPTARRVTTAAPTTTTVPATTAPATTVAPTLADALAGRYSVTSTVISDSLSPERAGSTQPWPPLDLSVDCSIDPCVIADAIWGTATLVGDAITFTMNGTADCLGADRTMDVLITLVPGPRNPLGQIETLAGTAVFTWGAIGQCPGFVEQYALTATRLADG